MTYRPANHPANQVWLSLGSNLGNREDHLIRGLRDLMNGGLELETWSGIYETEPVGLLDQPFFLNMTVRGRTRLNPWELLELCQSVERLHLRKRLIRWGPRTLDVDILLYENRTLADEKLILPHPRMKERAFVLIPLMEMDPETFEKSGCEITGETIDLYKTREAVAALLYA